MSRFFVGLSFVCASVSFAHPIGDVIALMQKLQVQAKEEGAAEAALFQKFSYWCKTSDKELRTATAKSTQIIDEVTDQIAGLKADITALGADIATLEEDLTKMNNAAAKAKQVRDDEVALYKNEQKNFKETIGAVDVATEIMDKSASLAQTGTARHLRAPSAPASKFKSGGIVATFEGMNDEFAEEKLDAQQQETNKQVAYKLAKQSRDFAIKAAEDSKKEKEKIKSDKESELADAESALAQEKTTLAGDSTTLDNTEQECTTKTAEWETRSGVREGEIAALGMAMKILSKVSGVRNPDEHEIPAKSALFAMATHVQQDTSNFRMSLSLLQTSISTPTKARAITLLKQAAQSAHSKKLQKFAEELMTYEGPFDKIKGMIQKMIFQLMAEQKDEDDHKNWCDLETEKNTESKADKEDKVTEFKGKIKEMDAKIKTLVSKISENDEKVAELTSTMKEEKELRAENHAEIVATIKDSQDAQKAVTQAIGVLKDFYKSSGQVPKEPWEFVQLPSKPETWDSSYSGTADPTNPQDGVLAILDGAMQKFSTMEADAKAQDETDQQNIEKDLAGMTVELETAKQDSLMKTSKKDALQGKMEAAAAQLKSTTSERDAVDQYLKDLEPACGAGDSSYGDRKEARSAEIEALRKAQGILEEAFRAK